MVPYNPRRPTHHHRLPRAGRPSAGRRRPEARRRPDYTCATLLMAPEMPWFGQTQTTRLFCWRRLARKVQIRWRHPVDVLKRETDARRPRGTGGRYLLL